MILEMSMLLQRFLLARCGKQAREKKTVVGTSSRGPFVRNGVRPGVPGSSRWELQTGFFSKLESDRRALSDRIQVETNFAEVSGLVPPQDKVYRVRRFW